MSLTLQWVIVASLLVGYVSVKLRLAHNRHIQHLIVGTSRNGGRAHELYVAVMLMEGHEEGLLMLSYTNRDGQNVVMPWIATDEEAALAGLPRLREKLAQDGRSEFDDVQLRRYAPWDLVEWIRKGGA